MHSARIGFMRRSLLLDQWKIGRQIHITPCRPAEMFLCCNLLPQLIVQLLFMNIVTSQQLSEWVITNKEDVFKGVPVDFHYTDLSISSELTPGGRTSAPGCPKNEGGYPWLHHADLRCYLAGTTGPCIWGEYWFMQNNSDFGVCYCGCRKVGNYDSTFEVETSDEYPDQLCGTKDTGLQVFSTQHNKCFQLFDQGPCESDEWLVATPIAGKAPVWAGKAFCEKTKSKVGNIAVTGNPPEFQSDNTLHEIRFAMIPGLAASIPAVKCAKGGTYSTVLKQCLKKAPIKGVI